LNLDVRLCMFHPYDQPMERGWVGRVDGDRVLHLAAQTLQSFFLGGGGAREHAEYPLADVTFLVPVLHPPTVRVFDDPETFAFANPTAVGGPGVPVPVPEGLGELTLLPRLAAVVGAGGAIAAFSLYADWRAPGRRPPKDRDFAARLGPLVVTPDELPGESVVAVRVGGEQRLAAAFAAVPWDELHALAAEGTALRPGDLLVSPPAGEVSGIAAGSAVEIELDPIGVLRASVVGR
jgi:hypothetical protein